MGPRTRSVSDGPDRARYSPYSPSLTLRVRRFADVFVMYYFITFRTYGTWLHGDERGSVDRAHNRIGEPFLGPDAGLERYRRHLLKTPPVVLDKNCRACVDSTLREVAAHRGWVMHALNVLSNHVHLVVETDEAPEKARPEKVLSDFKAWATRRLREAGYVSESVSIWEHHGSTRYLKSEESLSNACHYVLHCQEECEPGA